MSVMQDWGLISAKRLDDGRLIGVGQMMFTYALYVDLKEYDYGHRYCYQHKVDAMIALANWDGVGDPPGPWIKRKGLGEDMLGPGALE